MKGQVDEDLQGKYNEGEVEQLIQVSSLCTQALPSERPKMSEVVRMLEGDGFAEKWEKWQQGMIRQDDNHPVHICSSPISPDRLSGPR